MQTKGNQRVAKIFAICDACLMYKNNYRVADDETN